MYTITPSSHRVFPLQQFKQQQNPVKTAPKVKNNNNKTNQSTPIKSQPMAMVNLGCLS